MYCICSVVHHRVTEKATACRSLAVNGLDPVWDETHEIEPWHGGEALEFAVQAEGGNLRLGFAEGRVRLASDKFIPSGFNGTLALSGLPNAMLHVRVSLVGPVAAAA